MCTIFEIVSQIRFLGLYYTNPLYLLTFAGKRIGFLRARTIAIYSKS